MPTQQDPFLALVYELLRSFPNTEYYHPPKRVFRTGYSKASVLVATFRQLDSKLSVGLSGPHVIKITAEEEARAEREYFDGFVDTALPSTFARPILQSSIVVDGLVAVAYSIAFGSVTETQTLRGMLERDRQDPEIVEQTISDFVQVLGDWYQQSVDTSNHRIQVIPPLTLLKSMIGLDKVSDLARRVSEYVGPAWESATTFEAIGLGRRLPNPVAYLQDSAWKRFDASGQWMGVECEVSPIHGDLHTGNIICLSGSNTIPMLIDFGSCHENGIPFFDLAYLEFDILRRSLPTYDLENRRQWLLLLDVCMKAVLPTARLRGSRAQQSWHYIKPVREIVQRMVSTSTADAELIWWLATVAVGLNFARKGGDDRPQFERESALLYAAYGLERLLAIHQDDVTCEPCGLTMNWLPGQLPAIPSLPISDDLIRRLAELVLGSDLSNEQIRHLYTSNAPDNPLWQPQWLYPQAGTTESVYEAVRQLAIAPLPTVTEVPAIPPLLQFAAMVARETNIATERIVAWIDEAARALGVDGALVRNTFIPVTATAKVQRAQASGFPYIVVLVSPVAGQPRRYDIKAWLFAYEDRGEQVTYSLEGPDEPVKAAALEGVLQAKLQEWLDAVELDPPLALASDENAAVEFILPYELYELDIESWRMDDGHSPLGVRGRLVIRALDRLIGGAAVQKRMHMRWKKRWDRLSDATNAMMQESIFWMDASADISGGSARFDDWALAGTKSEEVVCLALEFAPPLHDPSAATKAPLGGALLNGVPAIIWLRNKTPGILDKRVYDALRALVTPQSVPVLPDIVFQQRVDAALPGNDAHLGRLITLLWDNPHRIPPLGLRDGSGNGMLIEPRIREVNQ